jgi:hypothetical protein
MLAHHFTSLPVLDTCTKTPTKYSLFFCLERMPLQRYVFLLFLCLSSPSNTATSMASNIASLTLKEFFSQKSCPKILTLCGSQRIGSFNKILHDHAVEVLKKNGAEVTPVDLEELNLPLYNPNDETNSFPAGAKILKAKLVEAGRFCYSCKIRIFFLNHQ